MKTTQEERRLWLVEIETREHLPHGDEVIDLITDANRCAELEARVAELEAELALQKRHTRRAENAHDVVSNQLGQAQQENIKLRAGLEWALRLKNTLRDEYPYTPMSPKAVQEKLAKILALSGYAGHSDTGGE